MVTDLKLGSDVGMRNELRVTKAKFQAPSVGSVKVPSTLRLHPDSASVTADGGKARSWPVAHGVGQAA